MSSGPAPAEHRIEFGVQSRLGLRMQCQQIEQPRKHAQRRRGGGAERQDFVAQLVGVEAPRRSAGRWRGRSATKVVGAVIAGLAAGGDEAVDQRRDIGDRVARAFAPVR